MNQVELDNCCFLPKELIEYAKAHGIELLTHADRTGTVGAAGRATAANAVARTEPGVSGRPALTP